jgi:hypothetical protein
MRHINEPPPPVRDKRPDVPPRVEAAVQRAMAKDPADRFSTMAELCAELEACLDELRSGRHSAVTAVVPAVRRARRRSRGRLVAALLVLVALVTAAALLAYALSQRDEGGGGGGGGSGGGGTPAAVDVSAVSAYDPFGDQGEHDAEAPRATDGNASTYWTTETYRAFTKDGVGLVLDAGKPVRLARLGIVTDTPGFTASIRAGDSRSSFPETVAAAREIGGRTQIDLSGTADHRYYLVWITRLGDGYDKAHVNEVTVAA